MKRLSLVAATIVVSMSSFAQLPSVAVHTMSSHPTVAVPVLSAAQHVKSPAKARRTAADEGLQAAFSIQGASSQQTVWTENFDTGSAGWTLTNSDNGMVTWTLKKATGSYSYTSLDPDDVQSLFVEGDYRVYNRAIATATSGTISIPDNAVLHMAVGYSQNMNDYAILTLSVSDDGFTTATDVWSSDQETGVGSWRWHQIEVDFSEFSGRDVQLRFTYGPGLKDQIFKTGGYLADFYIDGLKLTGVAEINHIDVAAGEIVNFVDMSTGNIAQWHWSMPGATPDESSDPAPSVHMHIVQEAGSKVKIHLINFSSATNNIRSEERRVGKEC